MQGIPPCTRSSSRDMVGHCETEKSVSVSCCLFYQLLSFTNTRPTGFNSLYKVVKGKFNTTHSDSERFIRSVPEILYMYSSFYKAFATHCCCNQEKFVLLLATFNFLDQITRCHQSLVNFSQQCFCELNLPVLGLKPWTAIKTSAGLSI